MAHPLLPQFVQSCSDWQTQAAAQQQLQALIQAGETGQVLELLEQLQTSQVATNCFEYWLKTSERLLANSSTQRRAALQALAQLLHLYAPAREPAYLAALLVYRQPEPFVIEFLHQIPASDLIGLILQELVFRNLDCRELADLLPSQQSALTWLPLMLHPELELGIEAILPRFRSNGDLERPSGPLVDLPWFGSMPPLEPPEALAAQVEARTELATQQIVQRCFAAWRLELACFALVDVREPLRLHAGMLLPLGLQALAKATQVRVLPLSASEAYSSLMRCAAYGGAYGGGALFAQARVHVWQAFAAMLGLPLDTPFEQLAEQVLAARFWFVQADSPWFSGDYDYMLVVLSADRQRLLCVAVTSTD